MNSGAISMGLNHKFSLTGTFLNSSFNNHNSKSKNIYLGKSDHQNELPSPATKIENEDDSKNKVKGPTRMASGFLKHITNQG